MVVVLVLLEMGQFYRWPRPISDIVYKFIYRSHVCVYGWLLKMMSTVKLIRLDYGCISAGTEEEIESEREWNERGRETVNN